MMRWDGLCHFCVAIDPQICLFLLKTTMSSLINLLDDSSDDDIPPPSGLKTSTTTPKRPFEQTQTASSTTEGMSTGLIVTPAVAKSSSQKTRQPPKKKAKPSKAFSLIWVCTHGKGRRSAWRKKDLQIVGIYPTKNAAEEAKRNVMSKHQCCGHGDILVGGSWDDEVDLVIREAPMHF